MSYSEFDQPILITYQPPAWLPALVAIIYSGGIASLCVSAIYFGIKAILTPILVIRLLLDMKDFYVKRLQPSKLLLNKKDQWYIITNGEQAIRVSLRSASVVLVDLIMLSLVDSHSRQYKFILSRDNVSSIDLRRLRVRLYHPRNPEQDW